MGTETQYAVRVIGDQDLPGEVDWMFVRVHGCLQFWLKESVTTKPAALEEALTAAWCDYRRIADAELMSWPEPESSAVAC